MDVNLKSPTLPAPPEPPTADNLTFPPLPPAAPDTVKFTSVVSVGIPTLLTTPSETDSVIVLVCIRFDTLSTVLLVERVIG